LSVPFVFVCLFAAVCPCPRMFVLVFLTFTCCKRNLQFPTLIALLANHTLTWPQEIAAEQHALPLQTSFDTLTPFGSYLKQVEARWNFDHTVHCLQEITAFPCFCRSRSTNYAKVSSAASFAIYHNRCIVATSSWTSALLQSSRQGFEALTAITSTTPSFAASWHCPRTVRHVLH